MEEDSQSTLESVNLSLTDKSLPESIVKEQNRPITAVINGQTCNRVLLDPGATRTVIHKSLVQDSDYVQEKSYIVSANNAITVHPRAKTPTELDGEEKTLLWLYRTTSCSTH